jgi:hypothetical protein
MRYIECLPSPSPKPSITTLAIQLLSKHIISMSSKTPVLTSKAPKPLPGIYSQAIKAGDFVFVSGAVPMDPSTMEIIEGDIQDHTVSAQSSHASRIFPASPLPKTERTSNALSYYSTNA